MNKPDRYNQGADLTYVLVKEWLQKVPERPRFWAYLAVDPDDGDEGIVAAWINGSWRPLVGADEQRMQSLRSLAEQYAKEAKRLFRLVRFDQRTDVDTIDGRGGPKS